MILSDRSIAKRLSDGELVVDPSPTAEQFQPASLDVRIGNEIYDPLSDRIFECDGTIVLRPGDRLLGTTAERVSLPRDLAAQLTGRSTMGREGIQIHCTAGWIDPGFRGQITLELYNFAEEPREISVGSRVGQLIFVPLDQPSTGYRGQYQDQDGVERAGEL